MIIYFFKLKIIKHDVDTYQTKIKKTGYKLESKIEQQVLKEESLMRGDESSKNNNSDNWQENRRPARRMTFGSAGGPPNDEA